MPSVVGNLKSNKLTLQGHGVGSTPGHDITMSVVNNEFTMKMGNNVLMTVGQDTDATGGVVGEVTDNHNHDEYADKDHVHPAPVTFPENVAFNKNVTITGNLLLKGTLTSQFNEMAEDEKASMMIQDIYKFLYERVNKTRFNSISGAFEYQSEERVQTLRAEAEEFIAKGNTINKNKMTNPEQITELMLHINRCEHFLTWADGSCLPQITDSSVGAGCKYYYHNKRPQIFGSRNTLSSRKPKVTDLASGEKYLMYLQSSTDYLNKYYADLKKGFKLGFRAHICHYNPTAYMGPNPTIPGYTGKLSVYNTYQDGLVDALKISEKITEFKQDADILSKAPSLKPRYDLIISYLQKALNRLKIYLTDPSSEFVKNVRVDEQAGLYNMNPTNYAIGDSYYENAVHASTSYARDDAIYSMKKIDKTKLHYNSINEIINNYEFFLDDDKSTTNVEKCFEAGTGGCDLFNDYKRYGCKKYVEGLSQAQKDEITAKGYNLTDFLSVLEYLYKSKINLSDREVIGRDYGYTGFKGSPGVIMKPEEWNGEYLKYNRTLGFEYAWVEHYSEEFGTYAAWLAGDFSDRPKWLKSLYGFGSATNENLTDRKTFYYNFIVTYIKSYEKFVRDTVLPVFLTNKLLDIYLPTLTNVKYNGGYFSGFGVAGYNVDTKVTTYYFESNDPGYFSPGWFISTIVIHEYLLGHGLINPIQQIYLQQNAATLSTIRKFLGIVGGHTDGISTYTEFLGLELGIYNKVSGYNTDGTIILQNTGNLENDIDWYRLAVGFSDTSRSFARLNCDAGLNYSKYKWSVSKAYDEFKKNTGYYLDADVIGLGNRFWGWPAQSMNYGMGTILVIGARKRAESILGPKFILKEFIEIFLIGAVQPAPLTAVNIKVDEYIARKLAA